MSEAQILEKLPGLSQTDRKELIQRLCAKEQGISLEEVREKMADTPLGATLLREESKSYGGTSLAEITEALDGLTETEISDLYDHSCAWEEKMEITDFRQRHALLEEALNDPHPGYSLEEVREYLQKRAA